MVLRNFLQFLAERTSLNQSEIARRSHLSQAVINKILVGNLAREPATDTYRAIATTWSKEWSAWLEANPAAQQHLLQEYGWAIPKRSAETPMSIKARHAEIDEEINHVRRSLERLIHDSKVLQRQKAGVDGGRARERAGGVRS